MYKNWLFIALFTFISINSFAQEDIIAKEYFKKGEFEKALTSYQKLYKEQPNNQLYLFQIVKIEQELERYKNAENRLVDAISKRENPNLLIELGYNFQLQNDTIQAQTNYNKALNYLNWKTILSFHDTIKYTAEWYKNFYKYKSEVITIKQIKGYYKKINIIL